TLSRTGRRVADRDDIARIKGLVSSWRDEYPGEHDRGSYFDVGFRSLADYYSHSPKHSRRFHQTESRDAGKQEQARQLSAFICAKISCVLAGCRSEDERLGLGWT